MAICLGLEWQKVWFANRLTDISLFLKYHRKSGHCAYRVESIIAKKNQMQEFYLWWTMCICIFQIVGLSVVSLAAQGQSFHRTPELEMPAAHARRDNLRGCDLGCLGSQTWLEAWADNWENGLPWEWSNILGAIWGPFGGHLGAHANNTANSPLWWLHTGHFPLLQHSCNTAPPAESHQAANRALFQRLPIRINVVIDSPMS